jgi:hypothetical protein
MCRLDIRFLSIAERESQVDEKNALCVALTFHWDLGVERQNVL